MMGTASVIDAACYMGTRYFPAHLRVFDAIPSSVSNSHLDDSEVEHFAARMRGWT
jgi:hypothetical protein